MARAEHQLRIKEESTYLQSRYMYLVGLIIQLSLLRVETPCFGIKWGKWCSRLCDILLLYILQLFVMYKCTISHTYLSKVTQPWIEHYFYPTYYQSGGSPLSTSLAVVKILWLLFKNFTITASLICIISKSMETIYLSNNFTAVTLLPTTPSWYGL